MSAAELLFLVLAGLGAGLVGSITGLASLISYPALLAIGLPPVMANVTNTVALVFSSGGSVLGSRPELGGQATRLRRLGVIAVLGGVLGGLLLLLITPPGAFERIVPWLIAFAPTYPSKMPLVQLDYVYARGLTPLGVQVPSGRICLLYFYHGGLYIVPQVADKA